MRSYKDISKLVSKINYYRVKNEGENMNKYTIDGETTKKVTSVLNKDKQTDDLSGLISSIEGVNNSFSLVDTPDYVEPNFTKLESLNKSQEDIENEAKNSLEDYKNTNLSAIDKSLEDGTLEIENNKKSVTEAKDKTVATTKENYANAKKDASNDALKRGLARSSIVVSVLDAFSKDEIDTLNSIEKEYNDSISALDFELNALNAQKSKALNDFDIAYAVKLNDKIASLTKEYDEREQEIIEYNNDIAKKEKDYLDKYNSLVSDIQNTNFSNTLKKNELVTKYGNKAVSSYIKNQVYDLLDNYFANKSSDEIASILSDERLKTALGQNYEEALKRYQK